MSESNEKLPGIYSFYKSLVEKGVLGAARALGEYYLFIAPNPYTAKEGINYFMISAGIGDVYAMVCLGYVYQRGDGLPVNDELAMYWFQRAADAGDSRGSKNWVGIIYRVMKFRVGYGRFFLISGMRK